jgi:hypothetical protein
MGGIVCGFSWGGGVEDKDVGLEYGKALIWSCGTKAWV